MPTDRVPPMADVAARVPFVRCRRAIRWLSLSVLPSGPNVYRLGYVLERLFFSVSNTRSISGGRFPAPDFGADVVWRSS